MKNDHLKYYLVFFINETLFAYGNAHEFFEMYDRKNKKWIISKISYSQMLHDYQVKVISEKEAKKITNGNLPIEKYKAYCDRISNYK